MFRLKSLILLITVAITVTLTNCKKDKKEESKNTNPGSGVFISCEGPFQNGTGTVSFFDRNDKTIQNDMFEKVNDRPLGNIVQSIELYNGNAFIVVNNANKVEVVDNSTFLSKGVISGLTSPRYFLAVNSSKAYVSCWDNNVAVINLNNLSVSKKISTDKGPDHMLLYNNKVFVLNYGGFGVDSTITVIDGNTDNVIKTIKVYGMPNGICLDKNNKIWVLCQGAQFYGYGVDTKGQLLRINPEDYSIEAKFTFPTTTLHPDKLIINKTKDVLYYKYSDGIYSFDITASELNTLPFIKSNKYYYAFGFDDVSNMIYVSDPVDYVQSGWIFRYNANTAAKADSFKVGIVPGNFYFN